jgi:hypothetical protein
VGRQRIYAAPSQRKECLPSVVNARYKLIAGRCKRVEAKIQKHKTKKDVFNDASIAGTTSGKHHWASDIHSKRPLAVNLDMTTPGFKWQEQLYKFFCNAKADADTVHYVHDEKGDSGKSKFALKMCCEDGWMLAPTIGKRLARETACLWEGQTGVIFDLAKNSDPPYDVIKLLQSGCVIQTKYTLKKKEHLPPHVLVFSNKAPDISKFSADHVNIITDLTDDMGFADFFPPSRFKETKKLKMRQRRQLLRSAPAKLEESRRKDAQRKKIKRAALKSSQ